MKRFIRYLTVTAGLLSCAALYAEPPAGYEFLAYDEGLAQAKQDGRKVFVYFGRYGCGFCDKVNKESFSDPSIQKLYSENYVLVYVNSEGSKRMTLPSGERITEMQLGERMNTLGTPVFYFLDADGRELLKIYGYQSVDRLKQMHNYIADAAYASGSFSEYRGKR